LYSKDCFSGFVFFFCLFSCLLLFLLEDLVFVSSVLCFRCSHVCLFLLSSVCFLCVSIFYCIFMYFQSLGGSLWSLVGRLDVLGSAWGAVGAFLWALGTSLRVLGGSLGGRWEYLGVLVGSRGLPGRSSGRPWGCLGILGDTLGVPGCSWGLLGRLRGGSCGVLGESLSGPSAPYATHTDVSACSVFRCSCVTFWIICCSREA